MIKTGTKIRQNNPIDDKNGVQVVGGSNPLTPTIQDRHKVAGYVKYPAGELAMFGNKSSHNELAFLFAIQSSLGLSDTVMAQELGVSV